MERQPRNAGFKRQIIIPIFISSKVSQEAKIRNQYNQVPHLNLDTTRESDKNTIKHQSGGVAQSVTCLATDVSLTADPRVVSSIPARSHTFVEINH